MKILFSPNFKVIMYLFVFKFYPHGMRIRVYTQSFYSVAPCAFTSHDLLLQIFYNAFKFHLHSYANTYQLNRHYPIVFFLIINTNKIQFQQHFHLRRSLPQVPPIYDLRANKRESSLQRIKNSIKISVHSSSPWLANNHIQIILSDTQF